MKRPAGPASRPFRLDFGPLRQQRRVLELTQGQLAERCGVSRVTIWRLEHNRHDPPAGLLVALARAMGTPIHALFTVTENAA